MTANMWKSKDDILKDLAECGVKMNNVDDIYIVRGSRPPPPARINEDIDEEIQLRYGAYGDQIQSYNNASGPDLVGITKMLRMVNTIDEPRTRQPTRPISTSPNHKNTTLVISKLNPNVKEFVPKLANSDNATVDNKNVLVANVESTDSDEKQKAVALLKSKISAASKGNTIEKKKDKNVAMATLLRLHSGPPITTSNSTNSLDTIPKQQSPQTDSPQNNSPSTNSPLLLFTPEYFAGPSCTPKVLNVDDNEHTIPEPTPLLEATPKKLHPQDLADPCVKESIEKVQNWLESPQKKPKLKAPVPHLGPVTFKKKESIPSMSPCSDTKKAEPVRLIPSFVPSQYATELAESYKAQVKAKEEKEKKEQPPLDMWTKLEIELKARDEVIKDRRKAQSDNSSRVEASTSSSVSPCSSRH